MGRHADPRVIAGLANRVVRGAVRLRQAIVERTGRHPRLHALLEHVFGSEVATVLYDLAGTPDPVAAAGAFAELGPDLQVEVIRSIFDGLTYSPESVATIIATLNPRPVWNHPDAAHRSVRR